MKSIVWIAIAGLAIIACPALAQDEDGETGEIIVTGTQVRSPNSVVTTIERRPVIGLKRQADSAVRRIEILSDSREEEMRRREVQAMLLAAIDRAKPQGLSIVTGRYEVVDVNRESWRDQFPALAGKVDPDADNEDDDESDDDYDDEEEEDDKPGPGFEDDGETATLRLMVKTRLDGSIANARQKIAGFVKAVPATGRSQIRQKGEMALTIANPNQYRDDIYRRIADGAKHTASFYGPDYGVNVTGLDREIAWEQVSNTEIFLYIPYSFTVSK